MRVIELLVNGYLHQVQVEEHQTLAEVLRDKLGLTGTKVGCDRGNCGSCTVLVNGQAVLSCLLPVMAAQGKEITTIEGLSLNGKLDPVQEAFIEAGAIQCGFCTPGMIMTTKALLRENDNPSEEDIKEGLSGNLCRCTGYVKIVKAVKLAAKKSKQPEEHAFCKTEKSNV